uniref:Uncharacterized protein n=1 Tax=Anguilla anguilla TaxID=7936 RepID=A0A0E9UZ22_ANGAN
MSSRSLTICEAAGMVQVDLCCKYTFSNHILLILYERVGTSDL